MPGAISLRGVTVSHGRGSGAVRALHGVDLTVGPGELATLIGPSGSGKSTLLRAVAGLIPIERGALEVDGMSPAAARAAKLIGFAPQAPALLPWRSVLDNVRLPLEVNRRTATPEIDPRWLLERLGLGDAATRLPHQLSGGMAQRASIARAFVFGAPVLLLDEPFSALDELTRESARQVLLELWDAIPRTLLWVTHSVTEAVLFGDRVVVLSAAPGRVAATVAVDLPRPRPAGIEASPRFRHLETEVRRCLREGADAA